MAGEMIDLLKISSIAIIDHLEVEFGKGLNCITGETGAGKSLVIGALKLLRGAKATSDLIRPEREKAVIEALFSLPENEVVLRREIYNNGKNRCYVDGELTTTAKLAETAQKFINIYGQHQYQDLLHPSQQMHMLEEMADITRNRVEDAYNKLVSTKQKLVHVQKLIDDAKAERENLEHSVKELRVAHISEGEEEKITKELEIGHSAASLKQDAELALDLLYSGTPSLMDLSGQIRKVLTNISASDSSVLRFVDTINTIIAQIEEVNYSLKNRIKEYEFDPEKIQDLESRVHRIGDLKHKYKTNEVGLLNVLKTMEEKLSMIEDESHLLKSAQKEYKESFSAYKNEVLAFLAKRKAFGKKLSAMINRDLEKLGMSGTEFSVQQIEDPVFDNIEPFDDIDTISPGRVLRGSFTISTNVGQEMRPLARIASGGELSRIMLALKVQQKRLHDVTMIFDEIDSGISGDTALMMAQRLKSLSDGAQTIVVSHLHSLASLADTHLVIEKDVEDGTTSSCVKKVTGKERVMELARMMGGSEASSAVIEHAKELMKGTKRNRLETTK